MNIKELPAKPKEQKILRVAAYTRVSAEMEMKLHSLTAQEDYYREYIAAHPEWEFAGIYSDYGISGTTVQRPEFQRMLEDCRAGKIDLVITKSVTRFARNTVILLNTIRELKALGIDCYFEKEDMHSISPGGELLLTLLAMYAEEEARSASENQRWRIRKKFENGEPWVGNMLGYRLVNGKMVVVPEEAEIVQRIFSDYLSGVGRYVIARQLILEGIRPKSGKKWTESSIHQILTNEKYAGNMILQKTFRPDFRTKIDKPNRGEVKKYYVENSHEAIIDQETFDRVQAEMALRAAKYGKGERRTFHPHLFSGYIRCGHCGRSLKYYRTNAGKYDKAIWACPIFYTMGKSFCPSQKIPEDILIAKTKEILSIDAIDRKILSCRLREIVVPAHNQLRYILKDGSTVDVEWQHHSRKESWTPEMKQAAREKALKQQRGKEEK